MAKLGSVYNQPIGTNKAGDYAWAFTEGDPTWLGLTLFNTTSTQYYIGGTPTQAGTYTFKVTATDNADPSNADDQIFTLLITDLAFANSTHVDTTDPSGVYVITDSLSVGTDYRLELAATGGTAPYNFSTTGSTGGLPAGLGISSSGIISGTPTAGGTYYFQLMITDLNGATVANTFKMVVATTGGGSTTSDTSNTFCFIATAAYGSYLDPHVAELRRFRDEVLMPTAMGRAFVDFYYSASPPLADFIARHDGLRALTRAALTPVVYAVAYPLPALGIAFFGSLGLIGWRRRS
jgi:hypothetical protein